MNLKKCIAAGFRNGEPVDPKLKVWESEGVYYPRCLEPGGAFKFLGKSLRLHYRIIGIKRRWRASSMSMLN